MARSLGSNGILVLICKSWTEANCLWHRLADLLFAWYELAHCECLGSGKLHAHEMGSLVNRETHWLWCVAIEQSIFSLSGGVAKRGTAKVARYVSGERFGNVCTS